MRIIKLKCESDQAPYDQSVREVLVESEDADNWYGKPLGKSGMPQLANGRSLPGNRLNTKEARNTRQRFLAQAPNFSPLKEKKSMRTNSSTTRVTKFTRFALGQTFITPGAEQALQIAGQTELEFLRRHMSCDWGELSEEDIAENEVSLREGFRLLSAYRTGKGQRLWITTEADRSFTTILLPSEYQNHKREWRECLQHSRR